MLRRCTAFFFAAMVIASQGEPSSAQPKPAAPTPPPQFPTLTTPVNLGMKSGNSGELTLSGTNLQDAISVICSEPGVQFTLPAGQKDATKLKVQCTVSAKTPIGLHPIRVVTKYGVSNFRPFIVDEIPEVTAKAEARKRETAQALTPPCVVLGTAGTEASDYFKVSVRAGQRLTIDALGRRIGSPIDPVIILSDAKTGRELPGLYADDTPGAQSDARLTHTFKESGEIVVEVRDTTYRGGGDYAYRLRVADAPAAATAFPLAIEANREAEVGFSGPNLQGVAAVKVKGSGTATRVHPKRDGGQTGWPVPVLVLSDPQLVEKEPNNDIKSAQKLPVPSGVSAKFETKSDLDVFAIAGKKGQKLEIVASAYELNSPAEIYLKVLDAKGAELAKSNPTQPLAKVDFTPAADGEYYVSAEHLNYQYGPNEVYHLTIRPASPSFDVTVGLERVDVSANHPGQLPIVGLTKINGFNLPLELKVVGEGLSGSVTLPAGANPQPTAPIYLPVSVKAGTKAGAVQFQVQATAKIDGQDVTRPALATDIVKAGLSAIPNPPPELLSDLVAVVVEKPLFELAIALEKPEVAKGAALKAKISAKRAEGFEDPITLTAVGLPANVTAKLKPIDKAKNEVEVEITPAANAAVAAATLTLRGTSKHQGRDFAYSSEAAEFKIIEAKKEAPKKEEKKAEKKK